MEKKILTICAILLGSVSMLTAQVKLQTNNVDEVLKAMREGDRKQPTRFSPQAASHSSD